MFVFPLVVVLALALVLALAKPYGIYFTG